MAGKLRHPDVIVARERAHAVFDLMWSCGYCSKTAAYTWLRETFGRPRVEAHIVWRQRLIRPPVGPQVEGLKDRQPGRALSQSLRLGRVG